jgi:hypothetical protein
MEHLRQVDAPCILHVLTNALATHYVVFFGYDPEIDLYLIADPDGHIGYVTEGDLDTRWQSKAAIYFEHATAKTDWRIRFYPWTYILEFDFVPGILWFAVPLLSLFGSLVGLGVTLTIEKAVSPQFLNGRTAFMIAVFFLLFCLALAKCCITYVKERLIIKFAGDLDLLLYEELISPFERLLPNTRFLMKRFAETAKDVQRIHQSVAILVGGVLSDGLMVLIMLGCLYLYFPVLVALEFIVIILLVVLTNRQLSFMLVNNRSSVTVFSMRVHLPGKGDIIEPKRVFAESIDENAALARKSQRLSANANKLNFRFELTTAVNLVLVLAYTIREMRVSSASYQEFIFAIILCYASISMATKICNQLFLVAQGAEMLGQHVQIK